MSSIPPCSQWRGAIAFIPESQEDEQIGQFAAAWIVDQVYYYSVRNSLSQSLPDIEYRSSFRDSDIRHHVFRWDRAPYDYVFEHGFEARLQGSTPDEEFFNLEHHVNHGGWPLDTRRQPPTHAFVSTTMSSTWVPTISQGGEAVQRVYRYEIYAPGGILVSETLGEHYRHPRQSEVAFPAGIARNYIRSAQVFELRRINDRGHTTRTRVNNILYINSHFNPGPRRGRPLRLLRPITYYKDGNRNKELVKEYITARQKRSVNADAEIIRYYSYGVTDVDNYIDAAFRSTSENEAYMFINGKCIIVNYAPGTTHDTLVRGPSFIASTFHCLADTAFAEYGIDAAFTCHDKDYSDNDGRHIYREAMIFCSNLCARMRYAPNSSILEGPKTIKQMFPFFKGTSFEGGIDAAFESTMTGEAYLFNGSEYALINFTKENKQLIAIRSIKDGFQCFRSGLFEKDIGAAFAAHKKQHVYLFKNKKYLLFKFTPGETRDTIINGPKDIVPRNWPSLTGILPCKNRGLDIYEF